MIFTSEVVRMESFCFTPEGERDPIHIMSGALREWLHKHALSKVINLAFPRQSLSTIIDAHGLEQPRMESMTEAEAQEPVIVGIMPDGSNILIDGGHRRWFWALRGKHTIRGWAVPFEVWEYYTFDPASPAIIKYHDSGELLPQRNKS